MTAFVCLLIGLAAGIILALFAMGLAIAAGKKVPERWGPEADLPLGYQLTDRGQVAAELPEAFVLDERRETWGPA